MLSTVPDRRAPWVWAAIVFPIWGVLALCTHWEPVLRDGWGHVSWHRLFTTTPSHVWAYAKGSYVHNNPRLGQVLTMLVYTPGPWHVIVTPLAELALFVLGTTLVLGRWPSPRRTDDALVFATILALVGASAPELGPMLFYRPYTGNYLFGLVIGMALLVPYRLHAEARRRGRWWWSGVLFVLGAAAGLSNEHTGPALAVVTVFVVAVELRRRARPPAWMFAGLLGIVAGGLALYLAPGQAIRYNGLANQHSLVGRIFERGAAGNLRIFASFALTLVPLLPWLILGWVSRRVAVPGPRWSRARAVATAAGAATALVMVLTLLLSPKQGARLYFASNFVACVALASWVIPQLGARWSRATAWGLATVTLAYVGWQCVHTYRQAGEEYRARIAAILEAPKGGTVVVPRYSVPRSRWFLGEDFGKEHLRRAIAISYGLGAIELAPGQGDSAGPSSDDDP